MVRQLLSPFHGSVLLRGRTPNGLDRHTNRSSWPVSVLAVLWAGLPLFGCGSGEKHHQGEVEDTSARGVYIIDTESLPVLELEEDLRYGSLPVELGRIRWFGVTSKGDMLFSQIRDHAVRLLGPDGTPGPRIGGIRAYLSGGPPDFSQEGGAGLRGDTIWVNDVTLGRIGLFSLEGELLRRLPPLAGARWAGEAEGRGRDFLDVAPLALLPGDTLLAAAARPVGPPSPGLADDGARLLRLAPNGRILNSLFPLPGVALGPGGFFSRQADSESAPDDRQPLHAMDPSGSRLAEVLPEGPGRPEKGWQVRVLDPRGRELAIGSFSVPETWTPGAVCVGSDHRIWAGPADSDGSRPHLVLGPGLEPHAKVYFDPGVRVLGAGPDRVWVEQVAQTGELILVRYRVSAPR